MNLRWNRVLYRGGQVMLSLALLTAAAAPVAAATLLPHRAVYTLTLDGSRPAGQIEELSGLIDYEMTGDACAGYTTRTRQTTRSRDGEGGAMRQTLTSEAWEDGGGNAYRFLSTSEDMSGTERVEASVTRDGPDRLTVAVTQPDERRITLPGAILMPTEHVVRVLEAAAGGAHVFPARVYDGASDPARVYDTLAVIGSARDAGAGLIPAADAALKGHVSYPVAVSYFEPGAHDAGPAYVMRFLLYDNGVVDDLRIDYGQFAVIGRMASFESRPGGAACGK